jgi:hypothetical protein
MPDFRRSSGVSMRSLVFTLIKPPLLLDYYQILWLSSPPGFTLQPARELVTLRLLQLLQASLEPEKILSEVPHQGQVIDIQALESDPQLLQVLRSQVILLYFHHLLPLVLLPPASLKPYSHKPGYKHKHDIPQNP